MTGLRRAAEDYLAMRRALGFKLTTQAAQLMSFVDYCESRGSDRITSELALHWATTTRSGSSHDAYLARRLMTVRIFARHYQTLDHDSEIRPRTRCRTIGAGSRRICIRPARSARSSTPPVGCDHRCGRRPGRR
jgi:hypothetical protein